MISPHAWPLAPDRHIPHPTAEQLRGCLSSAFWLRLRATPDPSEGWSAWLAARLAVLSVELQEQLPGCTLRSICLGDLVGGALEELAERLDPAGTAALGRALRWVLVVLPDGEDPIVASDLILLRLPHLFDDRQLVARCPPPPSPVPVPNIHPPLHSPPPLGVGAPPTAAGAQGEGLHWVDVECGWPLSAAEEHFVHADMSLVKVRRLGGENEPAYAWHGLRVTSVVAADPNAQGITGLAPKASHVGLSSSLYSFAPQTQRHFLPGLALWQGLSHLRQMAGNAPALSGMIVVEQQLPLASPSGVGPMLPVEWDGPCYDVSALATALGVVVIEAAGNGAADLSRYTGAVYSYAHRWGLPPSGAILVGAGDRHSAGWIRSTHSNWGAPIRCFGPGSGVGALDHDLITGADSAVADFGDTSAATAVIAGLLLSLQGQALHGSKKRPLTPGELSAHLQDPQLAAFKLPGLGSLPDMPALSKKVR